MAIFSKSLGRNLTWWPGLFPPARVKVVRLEGRPRGGDIADLAAECQDEDELVGLRQTVEAVAADADEEAEAGGDPMPRLMLQPFSEVEAREIDWLWPMRIVSGGLTIVTGAVGQTKSMLTIDLATRVSLGAKHPDGSGDCRRGNVLLFGHEDAIHEVVKPRLVAAGADCTRVFYVHGKSRDPKCTDPDEAERVLFGEDIETLRRTLKHKPSIKLLTTHSPNSSEAITTPLPRCVRH